MTSIDELKVVRISGTVIPIPGDNIDTDRITPADAMTEPTFDRAVEYLFRDARKADRNHPFNDDRYQGASIMLVEKNFGSGSSRETAPQAIMRYGIKTLVGESFAAIFAGNCTALGMPAVTATSEDIAHLIEYTRNNPKTVFELNLETKTLSYNGIYLPVELPESTRIALMTGGWNAMEMLKANKNKINEVAGKLPYIDGYAK